MLTSDQQINRLLRAGSTYFNLNPFEVLQIEPTLPVDQIKKKYRSLSILVHPDKNPNNKERAQLAFDVIAKAWKILESDVTRKKCLDVYEEAKDRTDHMVRTQPYKHTVWHFARTFGKTQQYSILIFFYLQIAEKKKKNKKEGKGDEPIPEDDAVKYKHAIYVMVMKVSVFQNAHSFVIRFRILITVFLSASV